MIPKLKDSIQDVQKKKNRPIIPQTEMEINIYWNKDKNADFMLENYLQKF